MHTTLRTALLVAVLGSLITIIVATELSRETAKRLAAMEFDFRSSQGQLEKRVTQFAESDRAQTIALERLRELSENETRAALFAGKITPTPFPISALTGVVVELSCIDNSNKDTVYTASGTVVDKRGLIITNQHILLSEDTSIIRFCGVGFTEKLSVAPAMNFIATVLAVDKQNDLAILKITESVKQTPLPVFAAVALAGSGSDAKSLELGDSIFIGGYPGIGAETFTLTQGVVSGRVGSNFIKTSALIDTGTSGGAVFNNRGRFVGVATAAAKGEIGGSLGYLIGADVVERFMSDYRAGKNLLPTAK